MKLSAPATMTLRTAIAAAARRLAAAQQTEHYQTIAQRLVDLAPTTEADVLEAVATASNALADVSAHRDGMLVFLGMVSALLGIPSPKAVDIILRPEKEVSSR